MPKPKSFTPIELTHQSSASTFKQVLLNILLANEYIETFKREHSDQAFRDAIASYYNMYMEEAGPDATAPRNTGGITKANKLKSQVDVEALTEAYNAIKQPVTSDMYRLAAKGLKIDPPVRSAENSHEDRRRYIKRINEFSYCHYLASIKFPKTQNFDWKSSDEEFSPPQIELFSAGEKELKELRIILKGPILVPIDSARGVRKKRTSGKQNGDNRVVNEQPVRLERCLGHYLNYDRKLILADTWLNWQGNRLIKVTMEQRDAFRNRAKKHVFVAESECIINEDKTIYVVLKAQDDQALQLQITIERQSDENEQRNGTFSYLKYKKVTSETPCLPGTPFCGLVLLQTVHETLNIAEFEDQLKNASESITENTDKITTLLRNALRIRYRIMDQVIVLPKALSKSDANPWLTLQQYIGKYVCYYMRLSKTPAKFEISQIQIFPDGRATLRQPPDDPFEGYVRINGDRLWLFFRPSAYEEPTGKETVRFIVDKSRTNGQRVFRGMFSSQTMTEKRLVSGRMIMKQLSPDEEWPKIDPTEFQDVNYSHLPHEDDRKFFMEEWKPDTNLTDGPIWAEVAKRLQGHSALDKLNKLCTDSSINEKPFNNSKFYYYTFKADPSNKTQFLIERNLVELLPNGKVKIYITPTKYYEGYSFYDKNTLRLSLSYVNSGFLELFLELDDDNTNLSEIKILYGMSLWHSSKRLQGKMVVLSRYEGAPSQEESEQFKFTNEIELKKLEEEDVRGGGVMSYIRGELNRYMHATTDSSHQQFRPRDESFRQLHFLVACYFGYRLQSKWGQRPNTKSVEKVMLKACTHHLEQAFYHGYACSFAGMKLDNEAIMNGDDEYIEKKYTEQFLSDLTEDEKSTILSDLRTLETLKRIRQIAVEQNLLRETFVNNGPLDREDLRAFAHRYWKDLVPLN